MVNNSVVRVLSGALVGLACAPAVHAEENESDAAAIVVTGARAAQPAEGKLPAERHDLPQSVTVLDRSLLQSQGATSLADALRNVPGITLGAGEGGQIGNNINLNGFTARTDIYLDGIRDRGQYYRDTFALDSVEVLMGPSSMLFGRGSTGGVINQVSRRPRLAPGAEAAASVTTNGLVRATAGANQQLAPAAALRIDAMWQSGAPTTRRRFDVDDYGVAPSLAIGLGTPTQLTVNALVQHNRDRVDYGLLPLNGAPAPVDRETVYGYSTDRTIQDIRAVGAGLKHELAPGVVLRDRVQYNQVDTDAVVTAPSVIGTVDAAGFHALASSATVTPSSTLPLTGLSVRLGSHDRVIRDTSLFNQAELAARFATGGIGHDLLIGVELGRDTYRNQGITRTGTCNGVALNAAGSTTRYVDCVSLVNPGFGPAPATLASKPGNLATGRADTLALYANDSLAIGDRFKLVGGLRFERYSARITNSVNSSNTPGNTTPAATRQTITDWSVRAGAIWQPSPAQSVYFSYSTSFNPSLEQLVSTTGLTQPLPPERNRSFELGAKWDLAGGRLSLNAAAFAITKANARSQNADNTYTADGTVRVRGIRISATGRIAEGWQVFAGYTHLDARIVRAIAPNTQGKVPVNTPRHSASLWTTMALAPQWEIGGGVSYMSSRFANSTNLVKVGGYVRTDATVAWRQPRFDVRLNLFNLFDTRYYEALIQSDGGRAVPGTGRTAMVSFNWKM